MPPQFGHANSVDEAEHPSEAAVVGRRVIRSRVEVAISARSPRRWRWIDVAMV